jgi:hypothetical protein
MTTKLWTMKLRGYKLDYENDEPMTYLIEALVKAALNINK